MIAELGQFALILALLVSLVQGTLPLIGAQRGNVRLMALARPAALAMTVLVGFAFACLVVGFLTFDFSIAYVASHSNLELPAVYRVAAVWGGHEGSLLLWLLMHALWTLALAAWSRALPLAVAARVLGVLGLVAAGFTLFVVATSNPFDRLLPAPPDGNDLNPLLQDVGLIFHPPLLYMGYVGLAVTFAFAIAALLAGRFDSTWARWSRPWTTVSWAFLTLGIGLGSFWAYYELGWGGWWFWDPVENASLMPWLVATALMHSLAVTDKRGAMRGWTVLLAIAGFSLALLSAFLVRSGVITSVHAFALDPQRGLYILAFLVAVVGSSLALYAWRAPRVERGAFDKLSRESLLLANNVLFVVATATVLLGTLYPLLIDALGLGKISVGPPYFNAVFIPVMLPLLALVALGPMARWKSFDAAEVARRLRWAAAAALIVAAVVPYLMGEWTPMAALGMAVATWIAAAIVLQVVQRLRTGWTASPSFWGMHTAHLGVAVLVVGVTLVESYQIEREVRMVPGDVVTLGRYTVQLRGFDTVAGPNFMAQRGHFMLLRDGNEMRMMKPEKRTYPSTEMPMAEVALDRGFTRDIYIALGEPLEGGAAWSVRVYRKPFVNWLWAGALLMALGAGLAAADRRYRFAMQRRAERAAGAEAPA